MPPATPTPADHFRAYVERADADEAGTARVRRAMAGESTARFRDRLLLERAAYLARQTDRRLRDIAADCGFRGYDVFVRAFRRELGAGPSEWRADPTSWAIDAPGDVHFQPPDGIRLPARTRTDGVDLVVDMVERHVRAVGELVDAAPADPALRPVLSELVRRMEELTVLVHEASYVVAEETLRERLGRVGPDYVATVALLGATGRFDEAVVDAFAAMPTTRTFGSMVTAVVTDADDLLRTARARLADNGAAGNVMGSGGANDQIS